MKRFLIALFFIIGAFFGLIWWFDVEQTGGSFSDFFADPIGGTESLFSRLMLWGEGMIEKLKGAAGGTADPKALAASMIAGFESFSSKAYADPPGQTKTYSIGYGHQIVSGDGFSTDSVIAEADALSLLQADLDTYANCVDNAVAVPLASEQAAALYSLCYNIGCGAFRSSTLLRLLNTGDYDGAAQQFAVWNEANGQVSDALVSRRSSEQDIFQSATAPASTDVETAANANTDNTEGD